MPAAQHCCAAALSSWRASPQVNVNNNRMVDVMCSGTDGYTYNGGEPWTSTSQPFSFINVTGLSLQGNTITVDSNCAASQVRQERTELPSEDQTCNNIQ